MNPITSVAEVYGLVAKAKRSALRRAHDCPLGSWWCTTHALAHRAHLPQQWLCRVHDSMMSEWSAWAAEQRVNALTQALGLGSLPDIHERVRGYYEDMDADEREEDPIINALLEEVTAGTGSGQLLIDSSITNEPEPPPGTAPSYIVGPEHIHMHVSTGLPLGSLLCSLCERIHDQRVAANKEFRG